MNTFLFYYTDDTLESLSTITFQNFYDRPDLFSPAETPNYWNYTGPRFELGDNQFGFGFTSSWPGQTYEYITVSDNGVAETYRACVPQIPEPSYLLILPCLLALFTRKR